MIFDVLGVQVAHIQLLHEADSLRAGEVAEGVTGQAQTNGRRLVNRWRSLSRRENVA